MEIEPRRGAPTVRLDDPVADAVASAHDDAARLLGVRAGCSPPSADAGPSTAAVDALLAALTATCGDLGSVNRLLADGVRDAARGLGSADDRVGAAFRQAAGAGS